MPEHCHCLGWCWGEGTVKGLVPGEEGGPTASLAPVTTSLQSVPRAEAAHRLRATELWNEKSCTKLLIRSQDFLVGKKGLQSERVLFTCN